MGNQILLPGDQNHEVASARRRLIRGTFAAPAVLALHSGSALAVTSSSLRCLTNGLAGQPSPVVNAIDSIVRVRLYFKARDSSWYLKGSDVYGVAALKSAASVNTSFLGSAGVWRQVILVANGTVQLGAPLPSQPDETVLGQKYIALRFAPGATSAVEIVGVVDGTPAAGSAVSFNCWHSIAG